MEISWLILKLLLPFCRTVNVGSQIYSNGSSVIRVLQVLWHPYSDTHLGILSSDSVFRYYIIFHLGNTLRSFCVVNTSISVMQSVKFGIYFLGFSLFCIMLKNIEA